MAKLKRAIIPCIILILFIALMTSGGILKKPFGDDDDVIGFVNNIRDDVNNQNWSDAKNHMEKLEKAWDIVLTRVQFSAEQERIYEVESSLAYLGGAIEAKDQKTAIIDIISFKKFWDNLED